MTFILSEINQDGIFMASDSSETWIDPKTGKETFHEANKTLYFSALNIGISTWGDATVGTEGINDWLHREVNNFTEQWKKREPKEDGVLKELTLFLAKTLDDAFGLDGSIKYSSLGMGLHIAGYNSSSQDASPGICHVHILPGFLHFDPQMTMLSLGKEMPAYHLRNGMYQEFALMWPALSGIDESFRSLIQFFRSQDVSAPKDPTRLRAEWLGNWVKQMCLMIKTAGLPEYIGKTVRVLNFDRNGKSRWFELPEMTG